MIQLPIEIGDIIRVGRFKNKRIKVKEIGIDGYGLPTVNGKGILKIRIEKLIPEKEPKTENNMKLNENIQELNGTKEGAQEAISIIESGLQGQVPYIEVSSGLIGRWDYLHIRVIFEKKEDWKNNIKQNAAQFVMTLTSDGTLHESHRHLYIPSKRPYYALDSLPIKFRKTKVKSLQDVISKISKYIQEVKKSFTSEGHPLKENKNNKRTLSELLHTKDTEITIKQKDGKWWHCLKTVDGEEYLNKDGFDSKEQAEHSALTKGYTFPGIEKMKGKVPEIPKSTKHEPTKFDKPKEIDPGKEKELKLEILKIVKRVLKEELNKPEDEIQKVLDFIKSQIGLKLTPDSDFSGIKTHNGKKYFNVILNQRTSESDEFNLLDRFARKGKLLRVEPNGVNRVSIFFDNSLVENKKKVQLKENTIKFKVGDIVEFEDKDYKVWSQESYVPYLVGLANVKTNEPELNHNGTVKYVHPTRVKKKDNLREVEITDPVIKAEMEEVARIADQMDRMANELKKLKDKYKPLEDKMLKLIEEAEKTGDRAIETEKVLITIRRKGYEADSVSWKEFYTEYYPKLNKRMRQQADELLKAHTTVKKVATTIAVQYKGEGLVKEENIITKLYNKLKNYISNLMNRLTKRGAEIDALIDKMKTIVS